LPAAGRDEAGIARTGAASTSRGVLPNSAVDAELAGPLRRSPSAVARSRQFHVHECGATGGAISVSDNVLDHIPALRVYSRALCGSGPDAEDLVQETLIRAIEYASSYKPGTNMRAWLFTIMRNRFYSNVGKRGRECTGLADCVSNIPQCPGEQEWHLRGQELARALAGLPVHYREAIVLVVVLGESYAHASRHLDCDIGTVKSRVNRARNKLRYALGDTV
jgi:RNA polymerase sigma-70 factor, ECF subfamily